MGKWGGTMETLDKLRYDSLIEWYKNRRILVTGHTGFKGSWLCRMLIDAGAIITGYALEPENESSLFNTLINEPEICSIIGDIRDLDHLKQTFYDTKPEIVIHMAAQPIVRTSYREPVMTYETNVMGTVNVCECVRLSCPGNELNTSGAWSGVRSFLNVTTDKVYENAETGGAFTEDMPLDGYDPYSNSKSCSELVTHSYNRSFFRPFGIACSTARAGNVIGGGDLSENRIIPDCVRAMSDHKSIVIRNPASVRPYQHVFDPLYAYLLIMKEQYEDFTKAGYYNVGPEKTDCITTKDLVERFCNLWGEDACYEIQPDAGPHEAGLLRLDCTKMKEVFKWHPLFNIDEALRLTVDWWKAHPFLIANGGNNDAGHIRPREKAENQSYRG